MNPIRPRALRAIVAATALASSAAWAAPSTLHPGESATFNFDATGLTPYAGVQGLSGVSGLDAADTIQIGIFSDWDGQGIGATSWGYGHDTSNEEINFPEFNDGLFSIVITSVAGTFTVDPYALVFTTLADALGQSNGIRVLPQAGAQVPEPGSLALLSAALAGGWAARRRRPA